jgi:hypothetical protein
VASGVLVEERVVERDPGLAHARGAVHERHLAQESRPLVGGDHALDRSSTGLGAHLGDTPVLEADLEPAHHRAPERERPRRADDALGSAQVGRGEDLLGGHVRDVADAVDGLLDGAAPGRLREEPDGEICAGSVEAHGVEPELVQPLGAGLESGDVLVPGLDRVLVVEPARVGDGVPEPLQVRLAEHRLRPTLGGRGDDRPVHESLVGLAEVLGDQLPGPSTPDAVLVEVAEQIGLGVARERDRRAALVRPGSRAGDEPRRAVVQRFLRRELDQRATEVVVHVEHVDVAGAGLVRGPCDRPDERRVLHEAVHLDELAWADVRAHADGELRVALQAGVLGHARTLAGAVACRREGCRSSSIASPRSHSSSRSPGSGAQRAPPPAESGGSATRSSRFPHPGARWGRAVARRS